MLEYDGFRSNPEFYEYGLCEYTYIKGTVAVIVNPIDEEAKQFYSKYRFNLLQDSVRMFMSMKTIETALIRRDVQK